MATNRPELPRMTLRPRMTKESLRVMLTKAFSLSSLRSETLTSVISIMRLSPRNLPWRGGACPHASSCPSPPNAKSLYQRPCLQPELRRLELHSDTLGRDDESRFVIPE